MTGVSLFVIALALQSFFAALTCHSLRDFSRSRLKEICEARNHADRFGTILKQYERVLLAAEALFVATLMLLAATCVHWLNLNSVDSGWLNLTARWFAAVCGGVALFFVLPWTLSRVAGERLLYLAWPALIAFVRASGVPLKLVTGTDRLVHRLFNRPEPQFGDASALTDEIFSVVDEGQREGVLESEARTMIHRVIELQSEDVAAIMTPRTDMVTLPVDASFDDARQCILETGHSRIPVIGKSTDDVIGILYSRDLLLHFRDGEPPIRDIVREPFYVPETKGIDDLLETMKRRHVQLAIVVDEYSGVAGLVTLEDAIEEIVGEIVDEYDNDEETALIRNDGNGKTIVDARVHIDDLNEQFEFEIPEDGDYDTIGGFALSEFGRIPVAGEGFNWRHLRFTVLEADKRRLHRLRIELDNHSIEAGAVEE